MKNNSIHDITPYYNYVCICTYLQHHTFYDFIVTKARGKSGPLFSFDVHDDVRLVNDAQIEKDEVCVVYDKSM